MVPVSGLSSKEWADEAWGALSPGNPCLSRPLLAHLRLSYSQHMGVGQFPPRPAPQRRGQYQYLQNRLSEPTAKPRGKEHGGPRPAGEASVPPGPQTQNSRASRIPAPGSPCRQMLVLLLCLGSCCAFQESPFLCTSHALHQVLLREGPSRDRLMLSQSASPWVPLRACVPPSQSSYLQARSPCEPVSQPGPQEGRARMGAGGGSPGPGPGG